MVNLKKATRAGRNEEALRRQFQRAVRRPRNAAPGTEPRTVGENAKEWPKLRGEWLSAFPDFPYHIRGLRCCWVGEGGVASGVYVGPRDRDLLQNLVDLANDRLADADMRWGDLPAFRHAVPDLHANPRDVATWPPNLAELRSYPFFDRRGNLTRLPFAVTMQVPHWRPDGLFDEVRLRCELDSDGSPRSIESEYRPYREGVGLDLIRFASHLTDDGWRYFRAEVQFGGDFTALVSPFEECQ